MRRCTARSSRHGHRRRAVQRSPRRLSVLSAPSASASASRPPAAAHQVHRQGHDDHGVPAVRAVQVHADDGVPARAHGGVSRSARRGCPGAATLRRQRCVAVRAPVLQVGTRVSLASRGLHPPPPVRAERAVGRSLRQRPPHRRVPSAAGAVVHSSPIGASLRAQGRPRDGVAPRVVAPAAEVLTALWSSGA